MSVGDAEHLREPGHRVGTHGDDPMPTWPLTGVSIGTELHAYPTRRAFSIRSDQGDFVIKVEPTPRLDLCTGDQLYVLDYLADRGFAHAPSVLRTTSGHRAVHIEQGMVCVLELVPDALEQDDQSRALAWQGLDHAAAALNAHGRYSLPLVIPSMRL